MSLINDMLRDLDARRGHPAAGAPAVLPVAGYPNGHDSAGPGRWLAVLVALPLLALCLPILTDTLAVFDWDKPGNPAMTAKIDIPAPTVRPAKHRPTRRSAARAVSTTRQAATARPATPVDKPGEPARTNTTTAPAAPAGMDEPSTDTIIVQRHDVDQAWRLAADAAAAGRVEQAIGQLEDILSNQGDHHQARLLLARQFARLEQPGRAETVLREGLAGYPLHAPYAQLLGRLLAGLGRHEEAIVHLQAALPGAGRNAGYQALLAELYRHVGKPAAAASHYTTALALAPDNGQWWLGLGIAEEQSGNPAAAVTAYRRSLQYALEPALHRYAGTRLRELAAQAPAGIARSEPAGKT
ncbi:MAG: tetratricopeptide repeat protein [Thiohalobacterales bacterium]|nr:tetratricopeptide repeat protein [Thiohalobacterales bacterium]